MTTVRLTFRMAADSSRKGTLYFQIIHRNTVKTLSTRCRIFADEWDEPNSRIFIMSPVSARRTATLLGIRNRIRHEMQRLNGIISKYDCSGLPYNTADIIHCYRNSQPAVNHSLFAFMHRHIRMLSAQGRLRTADTYRQTLCSITTFRNGADISLSMLTAPFVESYESWLRSRRLCRNTTSFYMRILRSVYNKASSLRAIPLPRSTRVSTRPRAEPSALPTSVASRLSTSQPTPHLPLRATCFSSRSICAACRLSTWHFCARKTSATTTSSTAARRQGSSSPSDGSAPCRPSSTPTALLPHNISFPSSSVKTAPSAANISTPCSASTATSRR